MIRRTLRVNYQNYLDAIPAMNKILSDIEDYFNQESEGASYHILFRVLKTLESKEGIDHILRFDLATNNIIDVNSYYLFIGVSENVISYIHLTKAIFMQNMGDGCPDVSHCTKCAAFYPRIAENCAVTQISRILYTTYVGWALESFRVPEEMTRIAESLIQESALSKHKRGLYKRRARYHHSMMKKAMMKGDVEKVVHHQRNADFFGYRCSSKT